MRANILNSAPVSSPSHSIRHAVARFGQGLLLGQSLVPLFEFVERLRARMGPHWPGISSELACHILKANFHVWSVDLHLQAPETPSHPTTGWVMPRPERSEFA
jgi:hypothetical protein